MLFLRVTAVLIPMAWLVAAPPSWAGYDEGMAAYRRGDYRAAHGEFRMAADKGDPRSQYMLGQMYERGQEVVQDRTQAEMWYSLAAAQGDAEAARARDRLAATMPAQDVDRARSMAAGVPVTPGAPPPVAQSAQASQAIAALPTEPPPSSALSSGPSVSLAVSREDIRTAQQQLRALGYDAGNPDGVVGPRTSAAVRAYQAKVGLPVTGNIDRPLLARLQTASVPGAAADAERVLKEGGRLTTYVTAIQQELNAHGYYKGPMSGNIDGRLRTAIRSYQHDAGLVANGQVSEALLDHLKFARPQVTR